MKDIDIGRYRVGHPARERRQHRRRRRVDRLARPGRAAPGRAAERGGRAGPPATMRGGVEPPSPMRSSSSATSISDALLDGRMPIDPGAARTRGRGADRQPLGLAVERAAHGNVEVINAKMVGGIRAVSVERGHDPRDFALVAGGGATSAHAARLAPDLGSSRGRGPAGRLRALRVRRGGRRRQAHLPRVVH